MNLMFSLLLLQLLLFTPGLIGACLYLNIRNVGNHKLLSFLERQSPFGLLFYFISFGTVILAILLIPFYFLNLPVELYEKIFVLLLLYSITNVLINRKLIKELFVTSIRKNNNLIILLIIVSLLTIDYILSLKFKAPLYGDSPVHISRINYILNNGYSISDPYFSKNGLHETRYSYNAQLGLLALYAKILSKNAIWVWQYSYAYSRLIIFLGIFSSFWYFFKKNIRFLYSYLLLFMSPFVLNDYFLFSNFPDRIVFAWIPFFLIGVEELVKKNYALLLLASSILIATTHPLYAAMAIAFLVIRLVVSRKMEIITRASAVLALLILSIPIIVNFLQKNYAKTSQAGFNSAPIAGSEFFTKSFGFIKIGYLHNRINASLLLIILFFTITYLILRSLKNIRLYFTMYFFSSIIGLLVFNIFWLSLFGYIILMKNTRSKLAIGLLIIFFFLFVYNPIFTSITSGKIQNWAIERIQEFNYFALIAPIISLIFWIRLPYQKIKIKLPFFRILLTIFIILIIESNLLNVIPPLYKRVDNSKNIAYQHSLKLTKEIGGFGDLIDNQKIYADPEISIYITAISKNTNIIAINVNNYSLSANTALHEACEKRIADYHNISDLEAGGVSEIILTSNEVKAFGKMLSDSSVRYMGKSGELFLYRLNFNSGNKAKSICSIPYGQ